MKKPKKETLQGWAILAGLTLVFIALKIAGVTPWGWLWVLAPLWLPIAVAITAVLFMFLVLFIQGIWNALTGGVHGKD